MQSETTPQSPATDSTPIRRAKARRARPEAPDAQWHSLAARALKLVKKMDGKRVSEAGVEMAAAQVFALLSEFNGGRAGGCLKKLPVQYIQLLNALARLSQCALAFERHRAQAARQASATDAGREKRVLTREDLEELEHALNLM